MLKKFICVLLGIFMCGSFMAGCNLVTHNDERDAQQVIVTIKPITSTLKGKTFTSEPKYIYKLDLISSLNQNAESYMQQNSGATWEQTVDALLERLIIQQLLLVESERLLALGELDWGQKEMNQKKEQIFNLIDSELRTIQKEILTGHDETAPDDTQPEEGETTYPVKPSEESDQDYKYAEKDENGNIVFEKNEDGTFKYDEDGNLIAKIAAWEPSISRYPGMYGDDKIQSLERESVLRFVQKIKDLVEKDFKVTQADKDKFKVDDEKIEAAKSKGEQFIYPVLGETHYLEYLVGVSAKQSILLTQLQNYITDSVVVTNEEVQAAYNTARGEQFATYSSNTESFDTAVKDGSTNIVYNATSNYFHVKHILLPFSEAQQAELKRIKTAPDNANKNYEEIRAQMVNEIVVYPHVNGEDDLSSPMTVDQAFTDIFSAMKGVASSTKEAERTFDDYIYKYNTDPGIFDKPKGYAVKAEGKGDYMEEFEEGAKELYADYAVGSVLPEYVVTDYGVHVMYYASSITAGSFNEISDYETPGQYKTYYELFEDSIKTTKENAAFSTWQDSRIVYYMNKAKVVEKADKRFKDLYKTN